MSSCVCCRLFICVYLCWLVIVQSTTVLQVKFVQVALLASATAPCVSSLASGSSFLVQSYIWQTHRTAHNSSLFTTDIGMLHRSAWVWCNSLLWYTNSIVRYLWRALVSHGQTHCSLTASISAAAPQFCLLAITTCMQYKVYWVQRSSPNIPLL